MLGRCACLVVAMFTLGCAGDDAVDDRAWLSQCSTAPTTDPLQSIPMHLLVIDGVSDACGTTPSSVLLINADDAPIEVLAVASPDARVSAGVMDLPLTLAPHATLDVTLAFDSDHVDQEVPTELVVRTDRGCQSFELTALSGSAVVTSAQAIDFGTVPVGESRTRSITIQARAPLAGTLLSVLSTGNEDVFQIDAQIIDLPVGDCDAPTVTITAHANTAGLVEADLYYEVITPDLLATAALPMRATFIEAP